MTTAFDPLSAPPDPTDLLDATADYRACRLAQARELLAERDGTDGLMRRRAKDELARFFTDEEIEQAMRPDTLTD